MPRHFKIPLSEALDLACRLSPHMAREEVEKDFRRALQLGEIVAEGRVRDEYGNWSSGFETVPQMFFNDNTRLPWEAAALLRVVLSEEAGHQIAFEEIPADLVKWPDARNRDGTPMPPLFLHHLTRKGMEYLRSRGRPDFANNRTGRGLPSGLADDRLAEEIVVHRAQVEAIFGSKDEADTRRPGRPTKMEDFVRWAMENIGDLKKAGIFEARTLGKAVAEELCEMYWEATRIKRDHLPSVETIRKEFRPCFRAVRSALESSKSSSIHRLRDALWSGWVAAHRKRTTA